MKISKILGVFVLIAGLCASSVYATNVTYLGTDISSKEFNNRLYVKYSDLSLSEDDNIDAEQLCVPLDNRLVFAIKYDNTYYVPIRGLGNNFNYNYNGTTGDLNVIESENQTEQPSDYVKITYDKLINNTGIAFTATIRTSYWDASSYCLRSREDTVQLDANAERKLTIFPNMVNREVTILENNATGEIISGAVADTYLDEQIIASYYKSLHQTIEDIFPMFYTEYKINSTGEIVKLISKTDNTCTILHDNGKQDTINSSNLTMCRTNRVNTSSVTNQQIINFIESKGFTSPTDYLVFTDLSRQYTHVLKKSGDSWTVVKSILSSSGLNATPTPTGTYHLTKKVPYFGVEKGYRCKNAVGFIGGSYLYHSTIFDKTGSYLLEGKGVLGTQASQGCIRFSPEEAEWFYNTLPLNSTVVIR